MQCCGGVQWVPFSTLPHCREQWAVGLLQYTAVLQGAVGTVPLSVHRHTEGGSGQWVSFSKLPRCKGARRQRVSGFLQHSAILHGAVGSGYTSANCRTAGAAGSGCPAAHCRTAGGNGQWVPFNIQPHRRGSGQWVSFSTPRHCKGQWVVGTLQDTAAMGILQCTAALLGAGGSGARIVHCRTTRGSGHGVSFNTLLHY